MEFFLGGNDRRDYEMLCCVGLIGGALVGQSLGGPWTFIAPAAGFGIGLVADMKFMHGHHHGMTRHDPAEQTKEGLLPGRETAENGCKVVEGAKALGKTLWFPRAWLQRAITKKPSEHEG